MSSSPLPNRHLEKLDEDHLYHIGYAKNEELYTVFSGVKFVVIGGSKNRMASFAELIAKVLGHASIASKDLSITRTDRFDLFKVGPVLSISHGMGMPSMSILLHEIIKVLYYVKATNAIIIRIGTSGGLGVAPGTVVVSSKAFNAFAKEEHEVIILGKRVTRPAVLDEQLAKAIVSCQDDKSYVTTLGGTMSTDDFYEGQCRLDGAICEHSEKDKLDYLHTLRDKGVTNIEMESAALAAICHKANIKCAIVCVTLLNRLVGDQILVPEEEYKAFQTRPQELVAKFIKAKLGNGFS
ncbi:hypothetical protein EMCRGX_G010209 [Ephydatia muelleri]